MTMRVEVEIYAHTVSYVYIATLFFGAKGLDKHLL